MADTAVGESVEHTVASEPEPEPATEPEQRPLTPAEEAKGAPKLELASSTSKPYAPPSIEISETVVNDSTCHYYLRYKDADSAWCYAVRRYSEFDTLRGSIAGAAAQVEGAEGTEGVAFPEKYWFGAWQADVVEERKIGLANWTNALLALEVAPPELLDFLSQEQSDKDVTKEMLERLGDPLVAQKGSGADEFVKYATPHGADGTHYGYEHDACMDIELAEKGAASMKPTTITALFDTAKVRGAI